MHNISSGIYLAFRYHRRMYMYMYGIPMMSLRPSLICVYREIRHRGINWRTVKKNRREGAGNVYEHDTEGGFVIPLFFFSEKML